MLSGGDMLIRALKDEGVEYVFGYPGGAVLPEITLPKKPDLRFVGADISADGRHVAFISNSMPPC